MCNELALRNPPQRAVWRVSDLRFDAFQQRTVAASSCEYPDVHRELEANNQPTGLTDQGESTP